MDGGDIGTTTTTSTTTPSIRDGVTTTSNESSTAAVPDWKRELIERRKNLAKTTLVPGGMDKRPAAAGSPSWLNKSGGGDEGRPTTLLQEDMPKTPPVAAVRSHSLSSSQQQPPPAQKHSRLTTTTAAALPPAANLSPTTTTTAASATGRSAHTATRSPGTVHHQAAGKFDFSLGKSVEASRLSTSSSIGSKSLSQSGVSNRGQDLQGPACSSPLKQIASGVYNRASSEASSPKKLLLASDGGGGRVKNHHNNCVDNNNHPKQRNNTTDEAGSAAGPAATAADLLDDAHAAGDWTSCSGGSSSHSFRSASIQCASVAISAGKRAVEDSKHPQQQRQRSPSQSPAPGGGGVIGVGCGVVAKSANKNKNHKMVAQEVCDSAAMDAAALAISSSGQCGSPVSSDYTVGSATADEMAEELKYGPGIVQRLRSRFMSYTMRLNAAKGQRPSLQNMRRATSLNNLLDDDEESTRTASPVSQTTGGGGERSSGGSMNGHHKRDAAPHHRHSMGNGFTTERDLDSVQCDGIKKYQNEMMRSRQLRRGNDSLKRARSVETLRYDSKAWERDVQMTTTTAKDNNNHHVVEVILNESMATTVVAPPKEVTIEDKILNARERGDPRPTRLKPFMDDTERPPPDLVKTTLMKFEATANRRGRAPTTRNGEVAAKVATYKSIMSEKPAILYPKPPLSPKKPIIKPRTSLHSAGLSPIVGHSNNGKAPAGQRSPSPSLMIQVDMTYKQSTPAYSERRNGTNLMASPPQTPPDLINNIGTRNKTAAESGGAQPHHLHQHLLQSGGVGGGGYESPITQLTNKLKSMHLQSPKGVEGSVGGGGGGLSRAVPRSDNTASSTSSASTAPSSATSSPVPSSHSVTGSYYLNGGLGGAGRLELGDVSAEDCYEYRDYDEEEDEEEEVEEIDQEAQEENDEIVLRRERRSEAVNVGLKGIESSVDDDDEEDFEADRGIGGEAEDYRPTEEDDDDEDEDGDEVDNDLAVRRINKKDLQNIGQAGTTQEFRFGGTAATKSHLPALKGARAPAPGPQAGSKMRFIPSGGSVSLGGVGLKQSATTTVTKNGHGAGCVQEIVLTGPNGGVSDEADVDCKTTTALLIKQIKEEARKCGGRDSVNQVNSNGNGAAPDHHPNNHNNHSNVKANHSVRSNNGNNSDNKQALTNREIEKNLINRGKSGESPLSKPLAVDAKQQQQVAVTTTVTRKKPWQEEPQTNTMVFNFSKRKDVPDYIDSDGMILLPHRKRELPKPGESGFVVLGDISLETSTDPDDAWTMGPPSPCNIVFENDNVIIDGRSNLRKSLNRSKWSIRFDDSLTSTFEYVSENSFLETYDMDEMDSSSNDGSQLSSRSSNGGFFSDSQMSHTGQKFTTISSAPLGSYTPMKGSLASNFELGVTKSPSPAGSSSVSMSPSPTLSKEEGQRSNGSNGGAAGEPESLQYLKPATDDQTVAWSEGTRVTDLLF